MNKTANNDLELSSSIWSGGFQGLLWTNWLTAINDNVSPEYFLVGAALNWKIVVACGLLGGLGMSAGFFDVPLASYLQKKSPIKRRGAILSATNCLGFSGILVASVLFGKVLRCEKDFGLKADLPPSYVVSNLDAHEQTTVAVLKNQLAPEVAAANALLPAADEESEPKKISLPVSELSTDARKAVVTELVWDDILRQRSGDDEKIATEKYLHLFPDDVRQVKLVARRAARQPWFSSRQIFLLLGIMTIPAVAYAGWRLPQKTARILFWWLFQILYRCKVRGLENIPEKGPAILVFNHCSWLDGATILTLIPRKMRTIAWGGNFKNFFFRKWADFCGVILVTGGPKSIMRGLETAGLALANGEMVAIFGEGGISRSSQIRSIKPGVMKLLIANPVPVIPVYIGEMWGSIFSYSGGRALTKFPNSLHRPLSVHIGKPMQNVKSTFEIQQALQRLSAESVDHFTGRFQPAIVQVIRQCKKRRFAQKVGDSTGQTETGGTLLTRVLVLRRLLGKHVLAADEKNIGILIPPSNGGIIVNIAIELDRRRGINLNYSLSEDLINNCIEQAGITTVLTSRKVMEKLNFKLKSNVVYLEDLKDKVTGWDKSVAAFQSYVVPTWILSRMFGLNRIKPNDLMTIIFTSGSTGVPKGVMLSQRNIISNVHAIDQAAAFNSSDAMIGILPFFHSFGYTAGVWAVMSCNIRGAYHFSPLDAKQVGKLAQRYKGTLLVATPTFLRSYLRRCTAEQFGSLDMAVVGAERLPQELAEQFNEKFGVMPVEGYGTTELSPITSVNVPHSRQFDTFQIDDKPGTVGRPLQNIAAKVTDLDTGEEVGANQTGMLWITGPNVMLGYLNQPELTDEVIVDGWYNTGDVVQIDEDGFIKITGRMSRFSKIGGEMVPHIKIEEILTAACDETPLDATDDQPNIAVTAVPHEKKGERLIVLHTKINSSPAELRKALVDAGLPNIYIPNEDSFREVEQLPLLGSGKLDLKGIKQVAEELFLSPTKN